MAERYCDGCGEASDDSELVRAYRRLRSPGGGFRVGAVRRFHPECLVRLGDAFELINEPDDGSPSWWD